jgi:hypothetical protein
VDVTPLLVVSMQVVFVVLGIFGNAASGTPVVVPETVGIVLSSGDHGTVSVASAVREHRLTVVVFFSATCPCFAVHRARLAALAHEMATRDVLFLVVDSERHAPGASIPELVPETDLRILRDDGGRLARLLDAQFATETFVFDAKGALRYRGGIDDERRYLTASPKAHLRDALERLLAGTAPAYMTSKALGCVLRRR